MSETASQSNSASTEGKKKSFFLGPIGAALLSFITTGIGATLFSNYLDSISKKRDLELAATRRAVESVKSVTDLIFERDTRANFVVSSIKRHSISDELKERKKAYDDVFIRYNSTIQSNLFRIREIFRTANYTEFEKLLEGPLRDLLIAEDDCLTASYDIVNSTGSAQPDRKGPTDAAIEKLRTCNLKTPSGPHSIDFSSIHQAIIHCEYTFSDSLFRIVQRISIDQNELISEEDRIRLACEASSPPDLQEKSTIVDRNEPAQK